MHTLTQSYVHGASATPLIGETVGAHFDRAVERWPEAEALVVRHQELRWSFAELKREVDAVAAGLLALGLEPGDRIGIWSQNNAEWVVTQFATAKAGLILVNINPAYRLVELEYALNKVGCKALVTAPSFKSSDYLGMLRTLAPELDEARPGALKAAKLPDLRTVVRLGSEPTPGTYNFPDLAAMGGAAERRRLAELERELQFDEAINIQFTSGTTGSPKGATLTHHNILNNGYFNGRALGLSENDRVCIPVPLYHCFGMVMGNMMCAAYGAAMIYPSEGFEPLEVLHALEAERCTALYGVPTMFIAELALPIFSDFDLSSLRTGIMAGAPCPVETMTQVNELMHMTEVEIAYGMTETSPVSFQTRVDSPLDKRVSTVGTVHPHVEVKIIDADSGSICPVQEMGELCT
ncbi:MAG: AMP-binding protein, partial [Alphaproteobacteria bacterium]|nr:AMP-binding protein [Alphaproteobacteria bacterium]